MDSKITLETTPLPSEYLECFYQPQQQIQIMVRAILETYNRFLTLPPDQIAKKAKDVIDFFVPTFKHEGFKEEREWRMIFVPTTSGGVKPRYPAARDMLIPDYQPEGSDRKPGSGCRVMASPHQRCSHRS